MLKFDSSVAGLIVVAAAAASAGCGQKGGLYLPGGTAAPAAARPAEQPAPAPAESGSGASAPVR